MARGEGFGPGEAAREGEAKGSNNRDEMGWFALKMAGRKGASLTGKRTSGAKLPAIIG